MRNHTIASQNDLKLHSFFSQGDMGDIMIERHRLLVTYAELVGSFFPHGVGSRMSDKLDPFVKSRTDIISTISHMDESLNEWVSFNMHTVTMYTISMIDKLYDNNYDGSLLAVKGFLSVIH